MGEAETLTMSYTTGTFRTRKKQQGEKYPTGFRVIKINQRRLKRLKNKRFQAFKKFFGITGRIKTHTSANPSNCFGLYQGFQNDWRQWKEKNFHILPNILADPS